MLKLHAAAELKLNIGCGVSGIEGWVNIDNSPTILLSRLPLGRKFFVLRAGHAMCAGLMFASGSLSRFVSLVHLFLARLSPLHVRGVAVRGGECFRVLGPAECCGSLCPTWAFGCATTLPTPPSTLARTIDRCSMPGRLSTCCRELVFRRPKCGHSAAAGFLRSRKLSWHADALRASTLRLQNRSRLTRFCLMEK